MALETLHEAQLEASQVLGFDMTEVDRASETTIHYLGEINIDDQSFPAYRAHSGDPDKIAKGGIRIAEYSHDEAMQVLKELAKEMLSKLQLTNHHNRFRGGKGLILADAKKLTQEQRISALQQYADLMELRGFADHLVDVPAGDVGTNGFADYYAERHKQNNPDDPYALAVITGKSPKNGGLEFRTAATGWGGYVSHRAVMDDRGEVQVTAALQGFGNVGAWYAHFATEDPAQRIKINAIGEYDGVIMTDHADGLPITREMVDEIGDNPAFRGSKIEALAAAIRKERPDILLKISDNPDDIITRSADYFIPAALGNVLNGNVHLLGATRGVIELANGPTTLEAAKWLEKAGLIVYPDIGANVRGVDCSIDEWYANIESANNPNFVPPTWDEEKTRLAATSIRVANAGLELARRKNLSIRAALGGIAAATLIGKPELISA